MPRSMWRGAIQFGLVTVPVKLYLATEARGGLSFNLLHKEDMERINMKIHCPIHGEIPRSETVRGFEYTKGKYVILEDSDFDNVPLKTIRSIDIELFVDANRESQATTFVKQAYYLEPEPIGRKAFYLLKSVLADENLSAIAKIVLKDREALASINPYDKTMLLTTLYWPDEVRAVGELDLPQEDFDFKPAEKQMAQQLVQAMKGEFDAESYKDEYREALVAALEAKVAGKPVEVARPAEAPTKIADLMSVLEASVAAARESRQSGAKSGASSGTKSKSATGAKAAAKAPTKVSSRKAAEKPAEERRRKTA